MLVVTELKRMRQRYDTAANLTSANPTLLAGEIGIESDTKNMKIGDGSTAWTSLAYASIGVTARDTSLGRLAIGGIELGDTGFRLVSGELLNGWIGTLYVRRTGNVVNAVCDDADETSATADKMYQLPVGFRAKDATRVPLYSAGGATGYGIVWNSTQGLWVNRTSLTTGLAQFNWTWTTDEAWPSSLPGTAA